DHHCHALRRPGAPLTGPQFRRHFSESADPEIDAHLPFSLFYRRGLRALASMLRCEPNEETVLASRASSPPETHARRLLEAANIPVMLVDTGFRSAENYDLAEQRTMLPCRIHEVVRLESLVEALIIETDSFAQLEESFRARLSRARAEGVVALKS